MRVLVQFVGAHRVKFGKIYIPSFLSLATGNPAVHETASGDS